MLLALVVFVSGAKLSAQAGVPLDGATATPEGEAAGPLAGTVTVSKVDFQRRVGSYEWNAMTIELTADTERRATTWLNNIKVEVILGFKVADRPTPLVLRAEAELVALERRSRKTVVFLIPREVVEQFQLAQVPDFWAIDLSVQGQALPHAPRDNRRSASVETPAFLDGFREAAGAQQAANLGMLVPIYLSPYSEEEFGRQPPAYLRRDAK